MIDDKTKELLLKEIERNGNVSLSCAKTGVDKSTFYRWFKNKAFKKKAEEAIKRGRETNCDIAESSLMFLVKQKKLEAVKYMLGHNSPRYKRSSMEHKFLYEKIVPPVVKQKTLEELMDDHDREIEEEQRIWDEKYGNIKQPDENELPTRIEPEKIGEIIIKEEVIAEPEPMSPLKDVGRRPRQRPHGDRYY